MPSQTHARMFCVLIMTVSTSVVRVCVCVCVCACVCVRVWTDDGEVQELTEKEKVKLSVWKEYNSSTGKPFW